MVRLVLGDLVEGGMGENLRHVGEAVLAASTAGLFLGL